MADEASDLDVLLVEDNPGDAKLVEHHLESPSVAHFADDVTIRHRPSLEEAKSALESATFDVLLLDLGLPGSTGLATLDRTTEIVEDVPIIVLTGMDDRETAMEAIERGAQDFLPKGELDGDRLVRSLRYAVVRSRQQRQLERQNEQMEFFNSILRHDLLNGMNVIQSRGELLARELDGEQGEWAETIVDWSENVTDLTRKVRSTLTTLTDEDSTELFPVRLRTVVDSEVKRARQMDDRSSITVECPDEQRVVADELLGDVIGNLLTNAVEHADRPVDITVTVSRHGERVRIAIADDGPGVPPSERERIFDRGHRGSDSSGTGFGLYFVDSMVTTWGGDVWVEANDRGGATFVVELSEPSADIRR